MKVSIIIRYEMMGCELQNAYIEGVFRDNGAAYTKACKLEEMYPDDSIEVEEYEVLDDPS